MGPEVANTASDDEPRSVPAVGDRASSELAGLRLRAEGLSKTFGPARVLFDVDLTVKAGEIHALLGANGSGKSTLVRLITGVYQPDPGGRIEINGRPVSGHYSPNAATELGVRVVHQEAPLIDMLTLAETVALHRGFPTRFGALIRQRALARETERILGRLNVRATPDTLAGSLSAAERAMVMLALALADVDDAGRLLVLDEPTASLPAADAERFLDAVRLAAGHGIGVLMVTHRLKEVLELSTRVTVLRGGYVVFHGPTGTCSHDQLVGEIVGEDEASVSARDAGEVRQSPRFAPLPRSSRRATMTESDPAALIVDRVCGETVVDVSFRLTAGEILGVSGIFGSGASEIGRLIAGVERRRSGLITVGGEALDRSAVPRDALALGVAYVPADRLREGGVLTLAVRDNILLPNLGRYWFRRGAAREDIQEVISAFDVRPPDPDQLFANLSGGNQQKVILGKWALLRPRVFVLDDPTAGVDPGARTEMFAVLRGLARAGVALLFISTEPEQLERVASRVIVVKAGRVVEELRGEAISEQAISRASL